MTGSAPTNAAIAALLERYGVMLQLSGESAFRARAYSRAAESVLASAEPMQVLAAAGRLQELPGVGAGLSAAIAEIAATGAYTPLDELAEVIPTTLIDLLAVPGIGIKTALRLYQELGIADLDQLAAALADGRIEATKGLGRRTASAIQTGLAAVKQRTGRLRLGTIRPIALAFERELSTALPRASVALAGSIRRWQETAADIDVVIGTDNPTGAAALVESLPSIAAVIDSTPDLLRVRLQNGIPVDLAWTAPARFGARLVEMTGPPAHLAHLSLAGVVAPDEDSVYAANGLPWIPPELRQGTDEFTLVDRIPSLITVADIKGEFHCHTTWSDGQGSVLDMANAAVSRGYAFLGISDHSQSLGVANGLTAERLRAQALEIANAARTSGIRLFRGCEVEVNREGALDFPDDVLAELDVVIASLHVGLRQPERELTDRLLRTLANPNVDIIAHPSGRLIEQREPGAFIWTEAFAVAGRDGTALEINADPARLDLNPVNARAALAAGAKLTINCDAHSQEGFDNLEYGVMVARQAWATPEQVINTWSVPRIEAWLADRHADPPSTGHALT